MNMEVGKVLAAQTGAQSTNTRVEGRAQQHTPVTPGLGGGRDGELASAH